MEEERIIYLVDGSSYLYRAYYAIKGSLTSPKGLPTKAIYGFAQMLQKVLKEKRPRYICVFFDAPGPKFRHNIYSDYKKRREKMPEDLIVQVDYIKKLIGLLGIPRWEEPGYEADDLIGSVVDWALREGYRVVIVSGDKDLHQLIRSPEVVQWDPQRDIWYDESVVLEKFGVPPSKMLDFLAIVGDKGDDVPGIAGIGEKGALKLLEKVNSVEELIERASKGEDFGEPFLVKKILENKEQYFLSRSLIALKKDFSDKISIDFLTAGQPEEEALLEFYEELGFKSFMKSFRREKPEERKEKVEESGRIIHIIKSPEELKKLSELVKQKKGFSIDIETTSENPIEAEIVGCAVSVEPMEAFYIHLYDGTLKDEFIRHFKEILESKDISKYGQNLKYEMVVFKKWGIEIPEVSFDTMVASYLLEPGQHAHKLKWIAEKYLGETMKTYDEVTTVEEGSKKRQVAFYEIPLQKAAEYAGADAEVVQRLIPLLKKKLEEEELYELYEKIELPLVKVLAEMEYHGVLVDAERLRDLSKELAIRLEEQEERIYRIVGEPFNIQSPKQLSYILFEKLKLPPIKKTKTGLSTDMLVLEELALHHPIAQEILAYRTLAKLKNTYVDKLPELINPVTKRIHTSYNQTVTATGRLSSSNPNLQNIPVRTEEGRRIREAFIPAEGFKLLSADYSQIELRIFAHYSGDDGLIEAFERGEDIHKRTASEIFRVSYDDVTPDMRRQAKTINFGIIYGMGPYKLSKTLGISQSEAKQIIERYFERYKGVKAFTENIVKEAGKKGYVKTLFGRKRWIPEIQSKNKTVAQQGERLAINTVIQGTAADIIKKAMVDIYEAFRREKLRSRLILQVHDELVFEVAEDELSIVPQLVKDLMERACTLKVSLLVEFGFGDNWASAHV